MNLAADQLQELKYAGTHHPRPGLRRKVLAVRAVGLGEPRATVARYFAVSLTGLGTWLQRYRAGGIPALEIAPGRGRKSQVDSAQVLHYALQSPRNFGVERTRWTLRLLAQTVPTLHGFSDAGVLRVLRRLGLSCKRGQPWMLSPDPEFKKKLP